MTGEIARLLRPYRGQLAVAFVALLAEIAVDLLDPWPLKVVFDSVFGSSPLPAWVPGAFAARRVLLLDAAAAAMVIFAVVGAVASYWEDFLSTRVGQLVAHDLRHTLYHHVQRLSLSFYDQRRTGDLLVRLTNDIDTAQDFVSSVLLDLTLDVLTLGGMLAIMLWLDWRFTLIALAVAPALFVVAFRLTRRIKQAARDLKGRESDLASIIQESMASMRLVQASTAEEYEERRFDRESLANVNATLRARRLKARLAPTIDVIVAAGLGIVVLAGGRFVLGGRLTSGALLVFVLYLSRLYKPMKDLARMADAISKSLVALDRIGELMRLDGEIRDRPGARVASALSGRIRFDHVSFGYAPGRPVLRDVELTIEPGQSVAVVGPTGGGKSTLLSLIPRFYEATAGEIRIDGRPIGEYTVRSLRQQIAFVLQDTVLFRASIRQNIAYGAEHADRAAVVAAARVANAHEFIMALPDGYDTVLGERGGTLSGGQRQRLAIARALVRDAPILLLDEPSASLDPESEQLVFEALRRLMRGRTTITIAHRLHTIERADLIVVLDQGRIVERGTHAALTAAGGVYARLSHVGAPAPVTRALSLQEA